MEEVIAMEKFKRSFGALIVFALMAYLPTAQSASAITVELAKKCRAMAIKAHPPKMAGSKAAAGVEKVERDYFNACVAKGGKTED